MTRKNNEPKRPPRRGHDRDDPEYQNYLFDWKMRNSWPFPPPGKPNPLITPTTVHGNYPRKTIMDKYTKEFFKHSAIPGRYGEHRDKATLGYFLHAMDAMRELVGDLYDHDAKFWISQNVHAALVMEFGLLKVGMPYTLFGIPYEVSSHMYGMECSLSAKGHRGFGFTIPEHGTIEVFPPSGIKPKPESSYGSYPKPYPIDFGLSRWLWKQLLHFIDWLNNIVGADKPKRKDKNDQHPSWLDVYREHQNEEPSMWFRPVLRLIDWLDGNAAPTKSKNASEQMETLADLFEEQKGITWIVDTVNGSDSNSGLSFDDALATHAEAEKRIYLNLCDGDDKPKPPESHPRFRPSEETVRR